MIQNRHVKYKAEIFETTKRLWVKNFFGPHSPFKLVD